MDLCSDNRFELIDKYKRALVEGTNISNSLDEMAVIDNILFRFWQMGWLDKLEANAEPVRNGRWINISISANGNESSAECDLCGAIVHNNFSSNINYCPNCGAKMTLD